MKKILLAALITLSIKNAQAQYTFEKIVDTLHFSGSSVTQTFDNGYLVAGGFQNGVQTGPAVLKLNENGSTAWFKIYTNVGGWGISTVIQLPDSGLMMQGLIAGNPYSHGRLMRIDKTGNLVWNKMYMIGNENTQPAESDAMDSLNQNIFGLTGLITSGFTCAYFGVADGQGNIQAIDTFPALFASQGESVVHTFDGKFVITGGFGNSFGNGYCFLMKLGQNADTIWRKFYSYLNSNIGLSVALCEDSGFIICGHTGGTFDYGLIIKTDSLGNQQWMKVFGTPWVDSSMICQSIIQSNDGSFVFTGNANSVLAGYSYLPLIKLNSNGDTVWTRNFGNSFGLHADWGYHLMETKDHGFIIVGRNLFNNINSTCIIKTDSMGLVHQGVHTPEVNNPFNFSIAPNPSNGVFTITAKCFSGYSSQLKIYNLANQCIYNSSICDAVPQQIDLSKEPAGMYLVMLSNQEKMVSRKIVVEK